jgi:hypothetical protein
MHPSQLIASILTIKSSSPARAIFCAELRANASLIFCLAILFLIWPVIIYLLSTKKSLLLLRLPLDSAILIGVILPYLNNLEEKENGILEWLRTLPASPLELVCAKFAATLLMCWILVTASIPSIIVGLLRFLSATSNPIFLSSVMIVTLLSSALGLTFAISLQLLIAFRQKSQTGTIIWIIPQMILISSLIELFHIVNILPSWGIPILISLFIVIWLVLLASPFAALLLLRQAARYIADWD